MQNLQNYVKISLSQKIRKNILEIITQLSQSIDLSPVDIVLVVMA